MLPPVNGQIRSPFGPRGNGYHYGVDYSVREHTPVYAVAAGTVVRASLNATYWNVVIRQRG
jgi:murein DD-endopeptidase MepM/ murein hydrolase activator NlpD